MEDEFSREIERIFRESDRERRTLEMRRIRVWYERVLVRVNECKNIFNVTVLFNHFFSFRFLREKKKKRQNSEKEDKNRRYRFEMLHTANGDYFSIGNRLLHSGVFFHFILFSDIKILTHIFEFLVWTKVHIQYNNIKNNC